MVQCVSCRAKWFPAHNETEPEKEPETEPETARVTIAKAFIVTRCDVLWSQGTVRARQKTEGAMSPRTATPGETITSAVQPT